MINNMVRLISSSTVFNFFIIVFFCLAVFYCLILIFLFISIFIAMLCKIFFKVKEKKILNKYGLLYGVKRKFLESNKKYRRRIAIAIGMKVTNNF